MAWGGRAAQKLVKQVCEFYGYQCWLCGGDIDPSEQDRRYRPSADHVIPRSQGGGDELENLRPAHVSCNSRRGAKPVGGRPVEVYRGELWRW